MSAASRLRIGLTGGIGSGKSTVAGLLQAHGATLIDTDAIARELTASGGTAIGALRERFGAEAIDPQGALDRAWMRARAFADPAIKRALESVLHPLIGARSNALAESAGGACIVFDVPLLVESARWRSRVDRVVVVDCSPEMQLARVMRRSRWEREAVLAVIAQQAPRPLRRAAADAVIDNNRDDLGALAQTVAGLWELWRPLAR